jgi:hypothetical protein
MTGRLRRILPRLLLALGGVLLALLLVEVAARALGLAAPPRPEYEGVYRQESDDPVLLFENRPGGRHVTRLRDRPGAEPLTIVYTINSLGLRGAEVTRERTPGRFRIACLGDSYTFGFGVNDDETWPAALERALGETGAEQRYEVLNFGVPAYDTEQEVRQLGEKVLAFQPDLVLIGWYLNDPAVRGGARGAPIAAPPPLVRWLAPDAEGLAATLRGWSQAFDFLSDRIYRRAHQAYLPVTFAQLYDDVHPGWRRAKQALLRARKLTRSAGIRFAVVLYPELSRAGDRLVSHEPYELVKAFCRKRGIATCDLGPVFEPLDLLALRVHARDRHPNGRAHELAGREVARWLEASGLLDPPR